MEWPSRSGSSCRECTRLRTSASQGLVPLSRRCSNVPPNTSPTPLPNQSGRSSGLMNTNVPCVSCQFFQTITKESTKTEQGTESLPSVSHFLGNKCKADKKMFSRFPKKVDTGTWCARGALSEVGQTSLTAESSSGAPHSSCTACWTVVSSWTQISRCAISGS